MESCGPGEVAITTAATAATTTTTTTTTTTMGVTLPGEMPAELWGAILSEVSEAQAIVCGCVCRLWRSLIGKERRRLKGHPPGRERDFYREVGIKGWLGVLGWLAGRQRPRKLAHAAPGAAAGSRVDILSWLKTVGALRFPIEGGIVDACYEAAGSLGDGRTIGWLVDNLPHQGCPSVAYESAAGAGRVDNMGWLESHGHGRTLRAWKRAIRSGGDEAVEWMKEHDPCPQLDVVRWAARRGDLPLVQWVTQYAPWALDHTWRQAAHSGSIPLVEWLYAEVGMSVMGDLRDAAEGGVLSGSVTMLEWLSAKGVSFPDMWGSARGGHWEAVKWLHSHGVALDDASVDEIAWSGDIGMLSWLFDNNGDRGDAEDPVLVANIAQGGSVDALAWARERGLPWDERACACAATGGHLEALRWLRDRGTPWDDSVCTQALREGYLGIAKWAAGEGAPVCPNEAYIAAAACGDVLALDWLEGMGLRPPRTAMQAAKRDRGEEAIEWLGQRLGDMSEEDEDEDEDDEEEEEDEDDGVARTEAMAMVTAIGREAWE